VIWLYTLRYYIIIFDTFCWSLSFPRGASSLTFCASFAPPVRKCNNVRDPYELPDFWPPNSPDLSTSSLQNLWQWLYQKKSAGCERFEAATDWCVSWSETKRYLWRCHWPVALWRRRLHAYIRATSKQFEYSPWHMLAKTLLTVINEVKIYC